MVAEDRECSGKDFPRASLRRSGLFVVGLLSWYRLIADHPLELGSILSQVMQQPRRERCLRERRLIGARLGREVTGKDCYLLQMVTEQLPIAEIRLVTGMSVESVCHGRGPRILAALGKSTRDGTI
jgi:hypothetical protein